MFPMQVAAVEKSRNIVFSFPKVGKPRKSEEVLKLPNSFKINVNIVIYIFGILFQGVILKYLNEKR